MSNTKSCLHSWKCPTQMCSLQWPLAQNALVRPPKTPNNKHYCQWTLLSTNKVNKHSTTNEYSSQTNKRPHFGKQMHHCVTKPKGMSVSWFLPPLFLPFSLSYCDPQIQCGVQPVFLGFPPRVCWICVHEYSQTYCQGWLHMMRGGVIVKACQIVVDNVSEYLDPYEHWWSSGCCDVV